MRPLTEEETKVVFEKLAKYIGKNIRLLIDRKDREHCLRLHVKRVYYLPEDMMRMATSFSRKNLISMGTCLGRFTHTGKFRLVITALDYLAQYAQYKIWLKPSGELSFLYGNHALKSGLGRITEHTPSNQGVVIFNMGDTPLGFGMTAKSTADCRRLDPMAIVAFHQADTGEYLRSEDDGLV